LQENVSAQPVGIGAGPAAPLEIADDGGTTLLAAVTKVLGGVPGPGECQIGLSQVGASRAKLLDLCPSSPVLVFTQYVLHNNRGFYLAKCLIAARAGQLSVMQSFQS
jgi:GntR family transcriptional regulator